MSQDTNHLKFNIAYGYVQVHNINRELPPDVNFWSSYHSAV